MGLLQRGGFFQALQNKIWCDAKVDPSSGQNGSNKKLDKILLIIARIDPRSFQNDPFIPPKEALFRSA